MFHTIILKTMQINYNKYTESELRVILKAARAINQIVHQTYNAIRAKYIARGIDPDAPDFVPDSLE